MKLVYKNKKLKEGDLLGARKEVSYLVGRDTENLDESEVAKADVETIAENTADGVIAPMLFIALGGAPLGFADWRMVTALISGATIGGKALGKPFAMNQSKRVVHLAGRFLHLFHRG